MRRGRSQVMHLKSQAPSNDPRRDGITACGRPISPSQYRTYGGVVGRHTATVYISQATCVDCLIMLAEVAIQSRDQLLTRRKVSVLKSLEQSRTRHMMHNMATLTGVER